MARQDPLRDSLFRLEIDGIEVAGFSEVSIGATTTDVIDYREGTDPPHVRKLAGLTRFGAITLKRGVTQTLELFTWHRQVTRGQLGDARRNVVILVLNESLQDSARYVVSNAWPSRYHVSDLNAKGAGVLIEVLELANEGIERVS